jgi:hypothetical protein
MTSVLDTKSLQKFRTLISKLKFQLISHNSILLHLPRPAGLSTAGMIDRANIS